MRPDSVSLTPAVFLDRDGTLMEDVDYCDDPARVKVFPGTREALGSLKTAGFKNIVITNQSGIGRGLMTEDQYRAVHAEFLRQAGPGHIDATYYCPDAPTPNPRRRKPSPAMVLEAARDHHLDLARSFFVGDKQIDVQCGKNAGVRTILVRTGYGTAQADCAPDFSAKDIVAAVRFILSNAGA